MHHHDVDPSLRAAEPALETLEDGFSPPVPARSPQQEDSAAADAAEPTLGSKSPF